MAGGKETPRQKMIGMMYLVLTALLALNVSKSILDAFVAIEENMQKANQTELFRGNEKKAELRGSANDDTNPDRAKKAKVLLAAVNEIDEMCAKRIEEIDKLKLEILEACGEDVSTVGKKECILISKYDKKNAPLTPARMNLMYVNGKDKYDDPMRIMIGDATDLKNPKGKGLDLWNSLIKLRSEITEKIASTHVFTDKGGKAVIDKKYAFKAPVINKFKDQADLNNQIKKSIKSQKVHPDDQEVILEIYRGLTKQERIDEPEVGEVHWIGKTFDHSPSVAAIASLTSLQKDVLAARAQAIALIRARVGGGEFSFNKILGMAIGKEVVNEGEDFNVQVMMAAYDSDIQPEVIFNGENVSDIRDGKANIKLKGSGAYMELSGTVSILNKSGIKKTMPWKKTVTVMKPAGAIEMPEYNIMYRGYANQLNATASGFTKTSVSVANGSKRSNGSGGYVISPGRGANCTVTVYGENDDGKKVKLKSITYKVTDLPTPTAYWGSAKTGGDVSGSMVLIPKYEPGMPLNAKFDVLSWEMSTPKMSGPPIKGTGPSLAAGRQLVNVARSGDQISIVAWIKGPDNKRRRVAGVWFKR